MKKTITLVICLFLTACSATGQKFQYQNNYQTPENSSILYIYKSDGALGARASTVIIDGSDVGELKHKGYLRYQIPPGNHSIVNKWSWDTLAPDASLNLNFEPGKEYFLKLNIIYQSTGVQATGVQSFPVSVSGDFKSWWELPLKEEALKELITTHESR